MVLKSMDFFPLEMHLVIPSLMGWERYASETPGILTKTQRLNYRLQGWEAGSLIKAPRAICIRLPLRMENS